MIALLLRWIYRLAWLAAALGFVLLALYASLGRHYVSYIETYADELVARIELATGQPLQVDSVVGRWEGLSPQVQLLGIRFGPDDPSGQPAVSATYGSVTLSLLMSALKMRPEISEIILSDLRVALQQQAAGSLQWGLAGIEASGEGGGMPPWLLDSILSVRAADFSNISAALFYADGDADQLLLESVRLRGDGDYLRTGARLISGDKGPLEIILESRGHPVKDRGYELDAYLKFDHTNFKALVPMLPTRYRQLAGSELAGEVWLQWRSGGRSGFSGHLMAPDLPFGSMWEQPERHAKDFKLSFGGEGRGSNWEIWLPTFRTHWDKTDLILDGLSVAVDDAKHFNISLPMLDLGPVLELVARAPAIPAASREFVTTMKLSGELHKMQGRFSLEDGLIRDLNVSSSVRDLAIAPIYGAPGARGLSGHLTAGFEGGTLLLDSGEMALLFPGIYDTPLGFDSLRGAIDWSLADNWLRVRSGPIDIRDGGLGLAAAVALEIPMKRELGVSAMNLMVGIRDGTVAIHEKYVPSVLSEGLRDWLAEALRQGDVPLAGFIYRGSLGGNDAAGRTVQLFLEAANVALKFSPDWPALTEASAFLALDDDDTIIDFSSARLGSGLHTSDLDGVVYSGEKGSRIRVKGKVDGEIGGAFKLVRESVLRDYTGRVFDSWEGEGSFSADIKLDLPLSANDKVFLPDVVVRLDAPRLSARDQNLTLTDMSGRLYFNDRGFYSRRTSARLFGELLDVDVIPEPGGRIVTKLMGSVDVSDIRRWSGQEALGLLSGPGKFSVDIFTGGSRAPKIDGMLDLQKVAIELPEPFGKAAGNAATLRFTVPLDSKPLRATISYDDIFKLGLLLQDNALPAVDFVIGAEAADPAPRPGQIRIGGWLDAVLAEEWLNASDRYQALTAAPAGQAKNAAGDAGKPPVVRVESLGINTLQYGETRLNDIRVSARNGDGHDPWQITLSSDMVEGEATVPQVDGSPIVVALERLTLPAPEPAVAEADSPDSDPAERESLFAAIKPADLPAVNLDLSSLVIGTEDWGSVGFDLRGDATGLLLDNIRGTLRGVVLNERAQTRLQWFTGNNEYTRLTGGIGFPDVGDALQRWEFPRAIESEEGRMGLDLTWPGKPDQIGLLNFSGETQVRLSKGRIPDSPDGASGALKIVGVFNLNNLFRRMKFDFSDLFEKGVHFDTVRGNIVWDKGVMRLPEQLVIDGPSSRFAISGQLDFATDKVDMELAATLPVANNLPWVAALVGGLPAAAGVYVVGKLFESQFAKMSSAVYGISGLWTDPEVKFLRVFDDSAKAVEPAAAAAPQVEPAPAPTSGQTPAADPVPDSASVKPPASEPVVREGE